MQKLKNRLQKLEDENQNIENLKKDAITKKEEIQKEITILNNQNEELTQIITEYADLNKDDQKYIDNLNEDITNLKISVSSFDESESSIEEIKERINQEIEANKNTIKNKKEQIQEINEENKNLENSIKEILEKIEQ